MTAAEAPVAPEVALDIEWPTGSDHARAFVAALASLFAASTEQITVRAGTWDRDDLNAPELVEALKHLPIRRVEWRLDTPEMALACDLRNEHAVTLLLPFTSDDAQQLAFFQSNLEIAGPVQIRALCVSAGRLNVESLHQLVGIAQGLTEISFASASVQGVGSVGRWQPTTFDGASALSLVDDVWQVSLAAPTLWFAGPSGRSMPARPPPPAIAQDPAETLRVLSRAVADFDPASHLLRLVALSDLSAPKLRTPRAHGTVLVLSPTPTSVEAGLDLAQPADVLLDAALHALAHVALGHIRPGDEYGHWDTVDTIRSPDPRRHWDAEVRTAFGSRFSTARKVSRLEECTDLERAWLGLHQMIGEVVGDSRLLHQQAERYQKAAYQRQAAQRLVAQLDEYKGAMLCDGVGLGKTYVGTTLVVHYANAWIETCKKTGSDPVADPFLITILAPKSVVSTWEREAMPPLAAFGVPLVNVRVISHAALSRLESTSALMQRSNKHTLTDFEHLLLSDLVLVDEAHNFRALAAKRTVALRDLLRHQPRRDRARQVALLTATPVNNSLEDLRQECALLFSQPLWLSTELDDAKYRAAARKVARERCAKFPSLKAGEDGWAWAVHGDPGQAFSQALAFRTNLDLGTNVEDLGRYLKEQSDILDALRDEVRVAAAAKIAAAVDGAASGAPESEPAAGASAPTRVAADLLDRIVVQRSRALCKEIERQQGSDVPLMFRPDAPPPERLHYSDEYDGIPDVLAGFLPLFKADPVAVARGVRPLSLQVYMWTEVGEGLQDAGESSPVVGLQRVLVLKRLESTPVSFLITLLRLVALHAQRLEELLQLALEVVAPAWVAEIQAAMDSLLNAHPDSELEKITALVVGRRTTDSRADFFKQMRVASVNARLGSDVETPGVQLSFLAVPADSPKRARLERLWTIKDALLTDLGTLLTVTPELTDIIFGKFARAEWPANLIAGGERVTWPKSSEWGLRAVRDAKLRKLFTRLLMARRAEQKVIVFSQFSDSLAYVHSVLNATGELAKSDWGMVARELGAPADEVRALFGATRVITGQTEERDSVVNAFAPFYRIGPFKPTGENLSEEERGELFSFWESSWTQALRHPIGVLLATDILAEGVNLQDAALLINFDVHWNPVRMIQRSGRIDRRLNPAIEQATEFPDLAELAARLAVPAPTYYWHGRSGAPQTINMILPDSLERELALRERIANKTLAIDFTLGLERGTGAEADWMSSYRYQGVSSLNGFQKDRAIEQIASYHEKLSARFRERGMKAEWAASMNGWFRATEAGLASPLIGRIRAGRSGQAMQVYTRFLRPHVDGGRPWWMWGPQKPIDSKSKFWMCVDGETWPLELRHDLAWYPDASRPVSPDDLLGAARLLLDDEVAVASLDDDATGELVAQGITAVAAGFLGTAEDRAVLDLQQAFVLQLSAFTHARPRPAVGTP